MKSIAQAGATAHAQQQKGESPFVSMQLSHRILIVGAVIIYLLTIGVVGRFSSVPTPALGWVFLALTLNISLLLLPIIFYQPSYGWFHPLVFAALAGLMQIGRKTSVYVNGLQWHEALPGWNLENLTLLVAFELALSSVGLVAYYFGFFFGPTPGIPKVTFFQPRHLGRKTLQIVIFSALVFAVYIQTRGGITAHILSWGLGRTKELAGLSYWNFFIQFGLIACLIWLAMDPKAKLKATFWGCTGAIFAIIFLTAGSRSIVIYFIILGLLVWQLSERKIAVGKLLIAAVLSLVVLGVLGSFRYAAFLGGVDWNILVQLSSTQFSSAATELQQRSGAGSGAFPVLALVPHQVDFLYGSSYLALLTLPIPKALWPEKPGLISGLVGQTFYPGAGGGIPPGSVGEAYWNFGIPGILIVFCFFGIFHKYLTEAFRKYANEPAAAVLFVLTLYLFDMEGTSILAWLTSFAQALVLLYALGAISFRRGAKRA